MNIRTLQKIASHLFPVYSSLLDRINYNALLKKWSIENSTAAILGSRWDLFRHISRNIIYDDTIVYMEFGVFTGDSLREWTQLNLNEGSEFYGFDTFSGLPMKWFGKFSKGSFDLKGSIPEFKDRRVNLIEGLFQETLSSFLYDYKSNSRVIVLIDCDLYESALFVLTKIDEILIPGSIIIFDDFADPTGEFRAYLNYVGSYQRTLKPIAMTIEGSFARHVAFEVVL